MALLVPPAPLLLVLFELWLLADAAVSLPVATAVLLAPSAVVPAVLVLSAALLPVTFWVALVELESSCDDSELSVSPHAAMGNSTSSASLGGRTRPE